MLLAACIILITALALVFYLIRCIRSVQKLKEEINGLQKINKILSEREELLTLVERISHLGSWELFIDDKTVKWSDELYEIYGFKEKNFLPDIDLNDRIVAPEYREKVTKELNSAITNKTMFAVEYQIILPSGIRKYVLSQGIYIEKEAKIVGTIQDITPLKEAVLKLRINESLLREAEMVSHSGSWEWTEGKEFLLWSDEMYNIHGFLPHSVFVNLLFYKNLVHENDLPMLLRELNRAYAKRAAFKISYRIVRPSGEIRYVLSTAEFKKIGLNDNYAYIGNTQDITELRETQVKLEQKIIELNRSNQDLEQFAYVASHDLQEPLRKIQTFSDRLKGSFSGQLKTEAIDYVDRMRNAAIRMRILIDDLLTFSKATRDYKNFVKVSLNDVLARAIKELDLTIEYKKAVISIDLDVEIDGIEIQLMQLFQNLISNSLKFTNQGVLPQIEVKATDKYGYELQATEANQNQLYCVIEVKDNGIGFEEAHEKSVFDIFQRLHSRNEYEGTGIGLAICKKIADNHSGFIFAKSTLGAGTTFSVILPKKQAK